MQIPQVGWNWNVEIDSSLDEDDNSDVEGKPGMKKCRHCGKEFTNQGLGGHMSRAHPGKSVDYQKKKETWNAWEYERCLLREAQKRYRSIWGTEEMETT